MYVEFKVPDLNDCPRGFHGYWMQIIFIKTLSDNYQISSLITSYVRLIEAALAEYLMGRENLLAFWNSHDSFNLGAMNRSVSHFESCLSDMHRAIRCFSRLRNHRNLMDELRNLFRENRPRFAADFVSDQIRNFRNKIHHSEAHLMDGRIQQGQSIASRPDGPEVPHPTEEKQTIKTIDRLKIGDLELMFVDLANWLKEMARIAENISNFNPSGPDSEDSRGEGSRKDAQPINSAEAKSRSAD